MDDGDIKTLYKDLEEKARQEEAASLKEDQDLEKAEKTETPLEGLNKEDSEKDQEPNTETETKDQATENIEDLEGSSQEDTIGEILENLEIDGQPLIKPLDQASPVENENPDLSPTMALGLFSLKARAGGSQDLVYNISGSLRVTGKAIKPGDKQVLKISPYLTMAQETPIKPLTMKVGETEVIVAEGIYDSTNKTITYTYNENISNLTDDQTYQIDLKQDFIIDTSTTTPGGTYYIENYFNGNVIGSQIINLPKEPDQGSFEPIFGNPLYYFDPTGGNDISLSAVGSPLVTNGILESINWEITINSLDGKSLSDSGLITNFSFVEGSGIGAIENFRVNGVSANLIDNITPDNLKFLMNSSYNYSSGSTTQEKITFTTKVTEKQESYSLDLSSMLTKKDAKPIGAKRLIVPGYTDKENLTEKPSSVYMNNRTTIYGEYLTNKTARWVVTDEVSSGDLVSLPLATRNISDNQRITSVKAAYYKINETTGKLEKVGEQEFNTPTPNIPSSGTYPTGKQPPGTIAVYEIKTEFKETGAGQIYSLGSGELDPWIGEIPVKTRWSNESTEYPAPSHTITATPDNGGDPIKHQVPAGTGSKELIDATIKNVPFYTYDPETGVKKINYDLTQQLPTPQQVGNATVSYYHNIMGVDEATGAPVFINSIGISEKVESKTANLTINKQDEKGNKLEGATFTITGVVNDGSLSSFKREITTGTDGKITLSELKPGSYNIVESAAPEGYSKSTTTHRIEVATNGEIKYLGGDGKFLGNEINSYPETYIDNIYQVSSLYYNTYMNTYDYAHYPGTGDYINYYIMLKPSVTYAGSGTDRATKLLVNGYNGDITGSEIKIYQFNSTQREAWVEAMQNQNIESILSSGTLKTFATQSGVFNENSTFQDGNTQVNFTKEDFQNNVGYVVKVSLKIRTKDVLSKLYFYWATQDDPGTRDKNEELTELSIRSARPFDIADPVYKGGELTLTNKPLADATLYFKKQNSKGDPLQGAEFGLYDTSENLLYTRISDSNGQVIIESLKEGEYILKETKAPEGYKLSTNYYKITVSADKKISYVGYDKDGKAIEGATGTGDGVIPDGSVTGPITGTTSYTVSTPLITHIDNAPYAPYNLDDPIAVAYTGEGIFDAHNAEHFDFRLKVNAAYPKQGDQIVIDFDNKWDLVKYAPVGFTFPNITDQNGNIVATPSVKYGSDLGDDNILTYTFNENAEAYTDFIADIKFDGFIVPDIYKVKTNGTYTFTDNVQVKSSSGTVYVNQSVDKTIYVNYGSYNDGSFKHFDSYVINYDNTSNPLSQWVPWITSGFQNIIKDGDKYYQRMMVIYNPNATKNDGTYNNRNGTFYGDVPPATSIHEVNVYRVTQTNGNNRDLLPVSTGVNPKGDPNYTPVGSLTGIQSGAVASSGNISYNPSISFKYDERNTNPLYGPITVTGLQPGSVGYGYAIELIYEITNPEVYARPSTITYNRPGTVFRFAFKSTWSTSVNRQYNM